MFDFTCCEFCEIGFAYCRLLLISAALKEAIKGVRTLCINSGNNVSSKTIVTCN